MHMAAHTYAFIYSVTRMSSWTTATQLGWGARRPLLRLVSSRARLAIFITFDSYLVIATIDALESQYLFIFNNLSLFVNTVNIIISNKIVHITYWYNGIFSDANTRHILNIFPFIIFISSSCRNYIANHGFSFGFLFESLQVFF